MVTINVAYTTAINPANKADDVPTLTRSQVWAGLQRKVRHAEEFVSAITKCTVLEDREAQDGVVVREAVFRSAPHDKVKEVCRLYEPSKIDFHQPNGSVISNIVSDGPSGEVEDMYMTYTFSWLHPELKDGDPKIQEVTQRSKAMAKMAVEGSIDTVRRLVKEGRL